MKEEQDKDFGAPEETGEAGRSEEEEQKEYERGAAVAKEQMGKRHSNRLFTGSRREDPRTERPKEAPAAAPAGEATPPAATEKTAAEKTAAEKTAAEKSTQEAPGPSATDIPGKEGEPTDAAPKKAEVENLTPEQKAKVVDEKNQDLENRLKKAEQERDTERGRVRKLRQQQRATTQPASTTQGKQEPPQSRKKIEQALKEIEVVDPEGAAHHKQAFDGVFEEIDALKAENAQLREQNRVTAAATEEDEMEQTLPGWRGMVLKDHPTDKTKHIFTEEFQEYFDQLPGYAQRVLTQDADATPEDYVHVIEPWYRKQKPGSGNGSQPGAASESALTAKRAAQRESAAGPASKAQVVPNAGAVTDKNEADQIAEGQQKAFKDMAARGHGPKRKLRRMRAPGFLDGK